MGLLELCAGAGDAGTALLSDRRARRLDASSYSGREIVSQLCRATREHELLLIGHQANEAARHLGLQVETAYRDLETDHVQLALHDTQARTAFVAQLDELTERQRALQRIGIRELAGAREVLELEGQLRIRTRLRLSFAPLERKNVESRTAQRWVVLRRGAQGIGERDILRDSSRLRVRRRCPCERKKRSGPDESHECRVRCRRNARAMSR